MKNLKLIASKLRKIAASKTYKVARDELLQKFAENGWKVSDPSLKVTHATSPDGTLRIWFKAQAVYFDKANNKKHNFRNARTLSYDLDIRKYDPQKIIDYIQKLDAAGRFVDRKEL